MCLCLCLCLCPSLSDSALSDSALSGSLSLSLRWRMRRACEQGAGYYILYIPTIHVGWSVCMLRTCYNGRVWYRSFLLHTGHSDMRWQQVSTMDNGTTHHPSLSSSRTTYHPTLPLRSLCTSRKYKKYLKKKCLETFVLSTSRQARRSSHQKLHPSADTRKHGGGMVAKLALDDLITKVGTPLGNCTAYFYFEKAAWSSWPSGASGIWCLP